MSLSVSFAKSVFLAAALLFFLPALSAEAQKVKSYSSNPNHFRASELVRQCRAVPRGTLESNDPDQLPSSIEVSDATACLAYLDGFLDLLSAIGIEKMAVCPTEITNSTIAKVFVVYMDKNPKYLDLDKVSALVLALRDAYPCKQKA